MSWIYVEPDDEDYDCEALAEGLRRLAESGERAVATLRPVGDAWPAAIRAAADARNVLGITWNGTEWVQVPKPE